MFIFIFEILNNKFSKQFLNVIKLIISLSLSFNLDRFFVCLIRILETHRLIPVFDFKFIANEKIIKKKQICNKSSKKGLEE